VARSAFVSFLLAIPVRGGRWSGRRRRTARYGVGCAFTALANSGRTLERPPRRRRRWTESATGSAAPPPRSMRADAEQVA